jgi:tripartite-type tricarboxylate transporter receptor subunit TctC
MKPAFPVAAMLSALLTAHVFGAQNEVRVYPNKPIRIVTSEVGGGADFSSRLIAQGISPALGQPVIVENRGGSGVIPCQNVAKAAPDGYTLLFISNSMWITPLVQKDVPYDPVRDFAPITLAVNSPTVLVVHPSVAAKSVQELINLAKANPGALNYAVGPVGASTHLAAELFKRMANIDIVRVRYKGGGPALNDLIAGQVQMMFPNAPTVAPHMESGRLRALAVTSAQPSALVPGLPTASASGVPGYEASSMSGMWAPARTAAAIVKRLNQDVVMALSKPDVKEKLLNAGVEAVASSPQELDTRIRTEMSKWGKLIKDLGVSEN